MSISRLTGLLATRNQISGRGEWQSMRFSGSLLASPMYRAKDTQTRPDGCRAHAGQGVDICKEREAGADVTASNAFGWAVATGAVPQLGTSASHLVRILKSLLLLTPDVLALMYRSKQFVPS